MRTLSSIRKEKGMTQADLAVLAKVGRENIARYECADIKVGDTWQWRTAIDGRGIVADEITAGVLNATLVRILGSEHFYWDSENLFILNPDDSNSQIRIGRFDGVNYGIGFTHDGGTTWKNAFGFDGVKTDLLRLGNINLTEITNTQSQHFVEQAENGGQGNFPARFDFYIPTTTAKVVEILLTLKITKYRADSRGAASGGGSTSSAGGSGERTSRSGGGGTSGTGPTTTGMTSVTTGKEVVSGSNHYHRSDHHNHHMQVFLPQRSGHYIQWDVRRMRDTAPENNYDIWRTFRVALFQHASGSITRRLWLGH